VTAGKKVASSARRSGRGPERKKTANAGNFTLPAKVVKADAGSDPILSFLRHPDLETFQSAFPYFTTQFARPLCSNRWSEPVPPETGTKNPGDVKTL
jgi:hypothetical protein